MPRFRRSPVLATALLVASPLAATVPAGFSDILVATVGVPTALAFTPDGRLLVTTQPGTLRVYQAGTLLAAPALTFPGSQICANGERGLLGVAVDPAFAANHFIYLFYTFNKFNNPCPGSGAADAPVNRVSRFTLPDSNVVSLASEVVLVDGMPSPFGNHNAGDVHFGKDGFLYISIGEGGFSSAARDEHVLTGKILRITSDGGIPAANPFQGAGTARCNVNGQTTPGNKCQETFVWGFRNPFRIAFDPNAAGTRFFINDVGQNHWEEIDEAQAGADYGWNLCEGAHDFATTNPCTAAPPGHVAPIFEYQHGVAIPGTTSPTNCLSITGGAFVPDGLWPGFDGSYLFGDFICGEMFELTNSGGVWSASDFGQALGGVTTMVFGPDVHGQSLYYTTFAGGGQVRRIALPPALDFNTAAPCRLIDTRAAGPALAAGSMRTFQAAGACGIPAQAAAISVNLTVTQPSSGGHLRVWPAGTPGTDASLINFGAGQTRANNAVVALGMGGDFSVLGAFAAGSAHLIVDVNGWFE